MGISRVFSFDSFIASLPRSASAREFPGPSPTCLQSRETADSKGILPFYEPMRFETEGIRLPKVPLQFGGWLRYGFRDGASFTCDDRQNKERCKVCRM